MRLAALVAVLVFGATSAIACPVHTAGTHDQTVAQSTAKKLPQSAKPQG